MIRRDRARPNNFDVNLTALWGETGKQRKGSHVNFFEYKVFCPESVVTACSMVSLCVMVIRYGEQVVLVGYGARSGTGEGC